LLGIKGLVCIFPLAIAGDVADTGVDAFASDGPYDAEETRDGATVVGPEKKLPSSSVSRKSLLRRTTFSAVCGGGEEIARIIRENREFVAKALWLIDVGGHWHLPCSCRLRLRALLV
jgi:hypothetical protein